MASAFQLDAFQNNAFEIVNAAIAQLAEGSDLASGQALQIFGGAWAAAEADGFAADGGQIFLGIAAAAETGDGFSTAGAQSFSGDFAAMEGPDILAGNSSIEGGAAAHEAAELLQALGTAQIFFDQPALYSAGLGAAGRGRREALSAREKRHARRRQEVRQAIERAVDGDTVENAAMVDEALAMLLLAQ